MLKLKRLFPFLFLFCGLFGEHFSFAEALKEYDAKAAFVYNFAVYTEWPETGTGPFNICVSSNDPISTSLEAFSGKEVKGAKIQIQHISGSMIGKECRILFFADSEKTGGVKLAQEVKDAPVLVICDSEDWIKRNAMIGVLLKEKKLTFEVNLGAVSKVGLKLSAKILKLAGAVIN
jgi:YfiR/HmsC-like